MGGGTYNRHYVKLIKILNAPKPKNLNGVKMTLKGLDIQEDCIKAISNESLIFDIKNKEFLEDIENLLL